MELSEAIKIIKIEQACVKRNIAKECDRDCVKCDLVRPDEDILNGYDIAIEALEKQIPKKPVMKGKSPYCPCCLQTVETETGDSFVDYRLNRCDYCGQKVDWEEGVENE